LEKVPSCAGEESTVEGFRLISTGSLTLDIATGIGGLPRGRVVEIYGPESRGRPLCPQRCCSGAGCRGTAAFIDAEHALDVHYAKRIGVNIEDLLISQPDTGNRP
jgi:recombination protein RecA